MDIALWIRRSRRVAVISLVVATGVLTGCASTGPNIFRTAGDKLDPIEPVNRVTYKFNDALDKAIVKPIAQGYKAVLPTQVRYCIQNVFGNVADVPTSLNNFLQGKFIEGGSDLCRVAINTTVGVAGCFDFASKWGFEKHNEDFGQTLGRWGLPSGPYLVLPFLGPSTLRDAGALLVDSRLDPVMYIYDVPVRNVTYALRLVDRRAQLLDAGNILEDAALDPYVFIRDAYLARRHSLVTDGKEQDIPDTPEGDGSQPTSPPVPAGQK